MSGTVQIQELLDFAVEAARQAGEITMEYFQTALSPERKPDRTFVTAADRQAEERLRALIRQTYPDHGIVGRSSASSRAAPAGPGSSTRSTEPPLSFTAFRSSVSCSD